MDILIVDDNTDCSFLLQMLLQNKGHVVDVAPSIAAAISAVGRAGYGCILLDLHMPGATPDELIQALPRTASKAAFVVVVSADSEIEEKAGRLGVSRWIRKPYDVAEILEILKGCSDRSTGA
jgi:two-component system response regulator FixJ